MRNAFASAVMALGRREDCFFITGDLGFMALEGVRDAFGSRFLNAGVAEQNMVGVAAGLAREGFKVFVYSIAPFCYARPFEQIRNDICLTQVPVCLVGNGGGYAYGSQGPTHHALEDCAAMNALGLRVLVPAFDEDLVPLLAHIPAPTYLRLGRDARPSGTAVPAYAPWRQIMTGERGALAALGPMAGVAWEALRELPPVERPAVWAVCEFDLEAVPEAFLQQCGHKPLFVVEEHVTSGGLGMHLALALAERGICVSHLTRRVALGYPTGRFGSQAFHRSQCALDVAGVRAMILGHAG